MKNSLIFVKSKVHITSFHYSQKIYMNVDFAHLLFAEARSAFQPQGPRSY